MAKRQGAYPSEPAARSETGGQVVTADHPVNGASDAKSLLSALKTLKKGDFGVRLPLDERSSGRRSPRRSTTSPTCSRTTRARPRGSPRSSARKAGSPSGRNARGGRRRLGRPDRVDQHPDRRPRPADRGGRPRHRRRRQGRPVASGCPWRTTGRPSEGRVPPHRQDRQHDGRPARLASPPRSPASPARSAPRASSAARPRSRAWPGTWKDLTDNVNLDGRQPDRPRSATSPRSPPPSPTATCRRRSPSTSRARSSSSRTPSTRWSTSSTRFASEVTRVAREVGTEGQAGRPGAGPGRGGRLEGPDRQRQLMAGNLTSQVRNIAEVTTAVANGDLRKKVTVDVKGEILQLKNTINAMVDQLNSFASRGHPRRPRGRHRGPAGRPGAGPGRGGRLEGPDRQRQLAWPATSPARCGTSPRSPPPSPTAT